MARKNEPYIYKVLRRETPSPRQQEFFRAEVCAEAGLRYGIIGGLQRHARCKHRVAAVGDIRKRAAVDKRRSSLKRLH